MSSQKERSQRILIVDDDRPSSLLFQRHLRKIRLESDIINDSREVIDYIKKEKPILVALDIEMPHITGLELLPQIRQLHNEVELPVLMISSHHETAIIQTALQNGANDYITKPINVTIALARIQSALSLNHFHELKVENIQIQLVKDMVCTYNHEINNPLMSAQMALEVENLEVAKRSLNKIAEIVHKIGEIHKKPVEKIEYLGKNSSLIKLD